MDTTVVILVTLFLGVMGIGAGLGLVGILNELYNPANWGLDEYEEKDDEDVGR